MTDTLTDIEWDSVVEFLFGDKAAFQAFFEVVEPRKGAERPADDTEVLVDRARATLVILGDCNTTAGPKIGAI